MEINSYTDPVASSLNISNELLKSSAAKYGLTKNDLLSAYRSHSILTAFKREINILAGKYMSREDARLVIDRLNRAMQKIKISVGSTSFKMSAFENE
jgi:hypothetical protein